MTSKRSLRIAIVLAIVAIAGVLALVALTGTSEASGPGGRGRGARTGSGGQGTGQTAGQATTQQGNSYAYNGANGAQNGLNAQIRNQLLAGGILADLPPAAEGGISQEAVNALLAGLQDEYHAAAIYQSVIDQFGAVRPFTNILSAEQSHAAALTYLLERYGIPVPQPVPSAVPSFASVQAACSAAAAAEIANFELYDSWLSAVQSYPDLTQVFTALRDASQFQHLPAFERCAG